MENLNKILTIGDIHGRRRWKELIFGGETEFFFWKQAVTEGYINFEDKYHFEVEWDKIIFVGDYVDSFKVSNTEIIENLKDIILFAKSYPELVVLLLGNHDVHYIVSNECCSGYRAEMRPDLNELFTKNEDLFKAAYLDKFDNGKRVIKTLWTHAGVTRGWYTELIKDVNSPRYKLNDFFIGSNEWDIDKLINLCWKLRVSNFFHVDSASGGNDLWAGPIWVRPHILDEFHLEGYDQVVGHTPHPDITQKCPLMGVESNPDKLSILTYVDVLGSMTKGFVINRKK